MRRSFESRCSRLSRNRALPDLANLPTNVFEGSDGSVRWPSRAKLGDCSASSRLMAAANIATTFIWLCHSRRVNASIVDFHWSKGLLTRVTCEAQMMSGVIMLQDLLTVRELVRLDQLLPHRHCVILLNGTNVEIFSPMAHHTPIRNHYSIVAVLFCT